MKIDKEYLEGQMKAFQAQREELKANLNATNGALQLCDHFLKVLDMEEPKDNRTPNEKGEKDAVAKGKKERAKEKAT